ncbi:MAG: S1 family peptidase [Gemmatimonadetes bacterium]|nr:S1 family peptidase [Gemmatimonadota bacterium]
MEAGEVRGLEWRFAEIEREVPGFGGYFFAPDGAVAAYVAEPGSAPAIRAVLARVLAERSPSGRDRRTGELRVLHGLYSFSQLAAWRDRLVALLPMPGVVYVDADEASNRVRIGVLTKEARLAVAAAAFQGQVEGTLHQQAGEPDVLGTEIADPPTFQGGACPRGRRCRYSDAARFRFAPGHVADPAIAGPAEPGSPDVAGTLRVAGENPYPVAGEVLDKVGAETGWTFGAVAATCVHVNVDGTDLTLLCQDVVDAPVEGGDSGAPVFAWRGGEATLTGVLWGGTGKRFYFSSMGSVEAELGTLRTR